MKHVQVQLMYGLVALKAVLLEGKIGRLGAFHDLFRDLISYYFE